MKGNRKNILIIDDDPNIRLLLGYVLSKEYNVVSKSNGLSGMAWMTEGELPDLIVSDIEMPRLNGLELLTTLQRSGFFRHIPVVMLSGHQSDDIADKCLKRGATAFIAKPFNPKEIQNCIKKVLSQGNSPIIN